VAVPAVPAPGQPVDLARAGRLRSHRRVQHDQSQRLVRDVHGRRLPRQPNGFDVGMIIAILNTNGGTIPEICGGP
jgi:hypothetical protein